MSQRVEQVYSWKFKNTGTAAITGFGAVAITGWERDAERGLVLLGKQAIESSIAEDLIAANGPSTVLAGKYGTCATPALVWASLKSGESPSHGDSVGAEDGEPGMSTEGSDFVVLGSVDSSVSPSRVLAYRAGGGPVEGASANVGLAIVVEEVPPMIHGISVPDEWSYLTGPPPEGTIRFGGTGGWGYELKRAPFPPNLGGFPPVFWEPVGEPIELFSATHSPVRKGKIVHFSDLQKVIPGGEIEHFRVISAEDCG